MIRRANIVDIPRLMVLLHQVDMVHHRLRPELFKPDTTKYSEQELETLLGDESKPIFVYDDGEVLGYAFCQITEVKDDRLLQDRKILYIDDLCVDEAARGKHIGSALFEFVRDYAKSIGCHTVTLNVWAGNDAAMQFYQSKGMRPQKTGMEMELNRMIMTIQEAIQVRHSVRQYKDTAIEAEKIAQLQALIDECNRETGVHIQLVTNEPNAFSGGLAKYGKFSGVSNYLAMIGKKGSDEAIGYCGEKIVLLAQTLGLNSCWVGLTFRKQPDKYEIREGEVLNSVIALGYGATQGVQHPQKKCFDDVAKIATTDGVCPEWFRAGVEAALLAPTAVNQQKFLFVLHDNNRVEAKPNYLLIGSYVHTDLGIVKYHFEVAAGKENFEWINCSTD